MITQDRLKQLLHYNAKTGIFTRMVSTSSNARAGDIAGCKNKKTGYLQVSVDSKTYLYHRLIWLYVFGRFPKDKIDHINGIRDDNRLTNIRECNDAENHQNKISAKNSTSKFIGVSFYKRSNKWRANIRVNGDNKYLGSFVKEKDAYIAYCNAKKKLHTFNPKARYEQVHFNSH